MLSRRLHLFFLTLYGLYLLSIVYAYALEAEAIVGFVARFLVVVAIFIKVPSGRYGIRHGCRV